MTASMTTLGFAFFATATTFSAFLILRSIVASNRAHPLSERACRLVLRFAAWLECVGAAWDAAILRYRMERKMVSITLASTATRNAAGAVAKAAKAFTEGQ